MRGLWGCFFRHRWSKWSIVSLRQGAATRDAQRRICLDCDYVEIEEFYL